MAPAENSSYFRPLSLSLSLSDAPLPFLLNTGNDISWKLTSSTLTGRVTKNRGTFDKRTKVGAMNQESQLKIKWTPFYNYFERYFLDAQGD